MKPFIRKSVLTLSLLLTTVCAALQVNAQDDKPVYRKASNPSIGITVANATGAAYIIRDKAGNIVLKGTIKNDKTFYINTGKLDKGAYQFVIGSLVLQEFVLR